MCRGKYSALEKLSKLTVTVENVNKKLEKLVIKLANSVK